MTKQIIISHEELRNAVLSDPDTRAEYDAFALQLNLSQQFDKQEKKTPLVGLVSSRTQVGVRRIPSLKMLVKRAQALRCHLQITLVPDRKQHTTKS